jgi:hypothetical protein
VCLKVVGGHQCKQIELRGRIRLQAVDANQWKQQVVQRDSQWNH